MIRYMIHVCNKREWYVSEFLLPSMLKQGIPESDIYVWHDYDCLGNLKSCINSFRWCGDNLESEDAVWHIQDDVIITDRFREMTERPYAGYANGFCNKDFDKDKCQYTGDNLTLEQGWWSFQCVRIPNKFAAGFAEWMRNEVFFQNSFEELTCMGRCDDSLFQIWMKDYRENETASNIAPCIVDHIDYLIGGTIINQDRDGDKYTAYWRDANMDDLVAELEIKLAKRHEEQHTQA